MSGSQFLLDTDTCIYAMKQQARVLGRKLVLVSNHEREFGRVPGLTLESWFR